jgi:hypothetical protein
MQDFNKQKKTYYGRITTFLQYLQKQSPNWVKERSWFTDLKDFELGENFYEKIFKAETTGRKEKNKFALLLQQAEIAMDKAKFTLLLEQAKIAVEEEIICTTTERGFAIEEGITDPIEQKEHETVLGYLWWYQIYRNASDAKELSGHQTTELGKKQEIFLKEIRRIASLSLCAVE